MSGASESARGLTAETFWARCTCGGSMKGSVSPRQKSLDIARIFIETHCEPSCVVTLSRQFPPQMPRQP